MFKRTSESAANRAALLRIKGFQNEKLARKWDRIARKLAKEGK